MIAKPTQASNILFNIKEARLFRPFSPSRSRRKNHGDPLKPHGFFELSRRWPLV